MSQVSIDRLVGVQAPLQVGDTQRDIDPDEHQNFNGIRILIVTQR